jgi:hypothetical protein
MIRHQSAWIMNGEAMTVCQIMDLSKRGAKIVPSSVVPTRFQLAFTLEDRKGQACEVVWRVAGCWASNLSASGLGRLLFAPRSLILPPSQRGGAVLASE